MNGGYNREKQGRSGNAPLFSRSRPRAGCLCLGISQPAANQLGGDKLGKASREALGEDLENLGGYWNEKRNKLF